MDFEWDEEKRRINLAKHRIDFVDASAVFDGRMRLDTGSPRRGEECFATTAWLEGQLITVIWTSRGEDRVRIISARRARDGEERQYRQLHG